MNSTRRTYSYGALGVAGIAAIPLQAQAESEKMAPNAEPLVDSDVDMYQLNTSLATINRIRREVIDACEDLTLADGTVVPAVWVKCRALLDGLGAGIKADQEPTLAMFDLFKFLCNNDESIAEIYVNSPLGMRFTAYDASIQSGRPVEECIAALEALAHNGALYVTDFAGR